jgi:hypothetical protein
MTHAARAGVLLCLIVMAGSAMAMTSLTTLQQKASQCFANSGAAGCNGFWDLSAQLKQQADKHEQLRCYSSLLALEAMVSMAALGSQDPARQAEALQTTSRECP